MAEIIRTIEQNDFDKISKLYEGRKSIIELNWLFRDPYGYQKYNGFVALDDQNNIIGVIGYSLSNYTNGKKTVSGVIPMSWKIIEGYKGFAGIQLFQKVLSLGEFGLAISGSETAKNLYPLFKLKFISNINEYYKILDLPNAFLSIKKRSFVKKIGFFLMLFPSYFNKQVKNHSKIDFEPYDGNNFLTGDYESTVFSKFMTKSYIDWLLECPTVKSYAFTIKKEDKKLGICVLFIQKVNHINYGRIIHLPYLGNNLNLWKEVICNCILFFNKKNCSIIQALGHHSKIKTSLNNLGFINPKNFIKPVYIKDHNSVLDLIDLSQWHFQFTEGDKAYRNF